MGHELQKKKNRSSIPKKRQKPKSKKLNNPRANAVIAANWDKGLSVAQNYRLLGLTSRLNHRTGGVENHKKLYKDDELADADRNDALAIGGEKPSKLAVEEVSVVKDPKTGKILRVVDSRADLKRKANPLDDPLNDLEDEYDEKMAADIHAPKTHVVRELEDLAARGEEKRPRKQSKREKDWVEQLVRKHGENYKAMSRDMKLNPMQQSEGDIRVRVQQWRRSDGHQPTESTQMEITTSVTGKETVDHSHGKADGTKALCNCDRTWDYS